MATVTASIKSTDLGGAPEDDPRTAAMAFCNSIDTLLGIKGIKNLDGYFYWSTWHSVPDEKAQAIEEIVGQTLWSMEIDE